ncbi:MAG: hypothetical protein K0R28_1931 [Paenibacillus sp.]|nr:hypothetical protein [Paenibacillus sp.]
MPIVIVTSTFGSRNGKHAVIFGIAPTIAPDSWKKSIYFSELGPVRHQHKEIAACFPVNPRSRPSLPFLTGSFPSIRLQGGRLRRKPSRTNPADGRMGCSSAHRDARKLMDAQRSRLPTRNRQPTRSPHLGTSHPANVSLARSSHLATSHPANISLARSPHLATSRPQTSAWPANPISPLPARNCQPTRSPYLATSRPQPAADSLTPSRHFPTRNRQPARSSHLTASRPAYALPASAGYTSPICRRASSMISIVHNECSNVFTPDSDSPRLMRPRNSLIS